MIAGFFVTIWIAAVLFKSNDILRKQTALKVCDGLCLFLNLGRNVCCLCV